MCPAVPFEMKWIGVGSVIVMLAGVKLLYDVQIMGHKPLNQIGHG
jgi:hypothetical protein